MSKDAKKENVFGVVDAEEKVTAKVIEVKERGGASLRDVIEGNWNQLLS